MAARYAPTIAILKIILAGLISRGTSQYVLYNSEGLHSCRRLSEFQNQLFPSLSRFLQTNAIRMSLRALDRIQV
jgi:hypothetical protein